jgi:hypothetical protein
MDKIEKKEGQCAKKRTVTYIHMNIFLLLSINRTSSLLEFLYRKKKGKRIRIVTTTSNDTSQLYYQVYVHITIQFLDK